MSNGFFQATTYTNKSKIPCHYFLGLDCPSVYCRNDRSGIVPTWRSGLDKGTGAAFVDVSITGFAGSDGSGSVFSYLLVGLVSLRLSYFELCCIEGGHLEARYMAVDSNWIPHESRPPNCPSQGSRASAMVFRARVTQSENHRTRSYLDPIRYSFPASSIFIRLRCILVCKSLMPPVVTRTCQRPSQVS